LSTVSFIRIRTRGSGYFREDRLDLVPETKEIGAGCLPDDPDIDAEVLVDEFVPHPRDGINAQLKWWVYPEELDGMKQNNTYVALHFPKPTTFETRYIVDGSPRQITIIEAVFLVDSGEEQNIIRTLAPDGPGVWTTSRDRGTLGDLVAPILAEGKNES